MCTAITCSSLSAINNGRISYSPDTTDPFNSGTVASHTCNDGFYLASGNSVRTCGGDGLNTVGSWSGIAPVCLGTLNVFDLLHLMFAKCLFCVYNIFENENQK